jgi:hypothetical protein
LRSLQGLLASKVLRRVDGIHRVRLAAPASGLEILDAFDGQQQPFLVPQLVEAHVLQILDGDLESI